MSINFHHRVHRHGRAQAVNEFLVFGTSATASLLAGTVMFYFGWNTLMLVPIPVLIAIALALVTVRKDPMLNRAAVSIDIS